VHGCALKRGAAGRCASPRYDRVPFEEFLGISALLPCVALGAHMLFYDPI
jgi:hypothetical protein